MAAPAIRAGAALYAGRAVPADAGRELSGELQSLAGGWPQARDGPTRRCGAAVRAGRAHTRSAGPARRLVGTRPLASFRGARAPSARAPRVAERYGEAAAGGRDQPVRRRRPAGP